MWTSCARLQAGVCVKFWEHLSTKPIRSLLNLETNPNHLLELGTCVKLKSPREPQDSWRGFACNEYEAYDASNIILIVQGAVLVLYTKPLEILSAGYDCVLLAMELEANSCLTPAGTLCELLHGDVPRSRSTRRPPSLDLRPKANIIIIGFFQDLHGMIIHSSEFYIALRC